MSSDPELLRRYTQESSQEAFAELVRRHIDFVYATALRQSGSEARAEDVAQAVFTDLAKKSAQLVARNDLVGWLHTSTHYAATTIRRSEARRETREHKAQLMHELDPSPESNTIDWDKLRPLLDDALHELGERDREAILLRYFKQRSFGKIGATLGLSEEAARKRIDRGVDKLRSLLAKRGITSTLVALELAMASQAAIAAPVGLATTVTTTALATAAVQTATLLTQLVAGLKVTALTGAIVASLVSVGLTMYSHSEARAAEQALATEKHRLTTLQNEQNRLVVRRNEIELIRTANLKKLAELKASVASNIHRIFPKDSGEKIVDALLKLSLDAEMKELLKTEAPILWSTQLFFGPLFAELKLTPQQIDRFFEITRGNAPLIPSYQFFDDGNGHGRFTYSLEWHNTEVDENALKQLLGDAGFNEFQEEWKTRTIRMSIVNKLASSLVYTDAPLTADIAKKLTRILASASATPEIPSSTDIDWEKALREAKSILSPAQLTALARLSGNLSTTWNYVF